MDKFVLLQKRLDDHIEKYEVDRRNDDTRWEHMVEAQQQNTLAINQLTDSTRQLVEAWQTTSSLGRFAKWLSGFAVLGGIVAWLTDHIK